MKTLLGILIIFSLISCNDVKPTVITVYDTIFLHDLVGTEVVHDTVYLTVENTTPYEDNKTLLKRYEDSTLKYLYLRKTKCGLKLYNKYSKLNDSLVSILYPVSDNFKEKLATLRKDTICYPIK